MTMEKPSLIKIDGSYGEGGGQVLRSTAALAALLGVPIAVSNIRKNRDKPGKLVLVYLGLCETRPAVCCFHLLHFAPNSVHPCTPYPSYLLTNVAHTNYVGLRAQHLAGLMFIRDLCDGALTGAKVRSIFGLLTK